ncbi:hypothetical protein LEM8419_01665 [Neolewinella maritima]|uniref:N-acetyltransferase domain-containing protein n=1 Tax=Neolewinella maritima TaxID=1383882 RepID=A0ABM9B0F7_9BACT|nr:GNAT family N-acetyltransferase [Neolewinella maritima]CAH1000512.1 hypothetical protein LEM8419_01665 [Neolewinella maritima]
MIELFQPTRDELGKLLTDSTILGSYSVVDSALPPRVVLDAARRLPPGEDRQYRWTAPYLIVVENNIVGSIGGKGILEIEDEVELGYNVARAYRRRGIATRAIGLVRDLARREGIWPLAHVEPTNVASRRALQYNGFIMESIVRLPDSLDLERWRLPDQYQPPLEGLDLSL